VWSDLRRVQPAGRHSVPVVAASRLREGERAREVVGRDGRVRRHHGAVAARCEGGEVRGCDAHGMRGVREMCCGTEAGSYLRLIDSCITQLKAQGPSRTCTESKEEEERRTPASLPPVEENAASSLSSNTDLRLVHSAESECE